MIIETILFLYSVALWAIAALLGYLFPNDRRWQEVDVWYYPLALIGVVLFFMASGDSRGQIDKAWGVYRHHEEQMRPLIQRVEAGVRELNAALLAALDIPNVCRERRDLHAKFCEKSLRVVVLPKPEYSMGSVPPSYVIFPGGAAAADRTGCAEIKGVKQAEWAARFSPPYERLDNAGKQRLWSQVVALREMCEQADAQSDRLMTELLENAKTVIKNQKETSVIPGYGTTFLTFAREWFWPFVIVLALAMKIGKTTAGVRKDQLKSAEQGAAKVGAS